MAEFVNLENTKGRTDGVYGNVIAQIQKDGVCPFCPEQLAKYHKNPILIESQYWLVTKNMYPYKGTLHHFLLIHKEHIEHMNQLTSQAWADLEAISNEVYAKFNITGGAFLMRFGDHKFTGASVSHLHAHIIVADPIPGREPVLARVG